MKKIWIILTLGLLPTYGFTAQKEPFAISFACGTQNTERCINGHFKVGETVYLLETESSAYCEARVIKQIRYSDEVLEFDASVLKGRNCKTPKEYDLAYVGKMKSYSTLSFSQPSPEAKKTLTETIKNAKLIETIVSEKDSDVSYTSANFAKEPHTCKELKPAGKDFLFCQYGFSSQKYGPIIVSSGKKTAPLLSKICASEKFRGFTIDNRNYLFGTSHCCECGWNAPTVLSLDKPDLPTVFVTGVFST